ncbi:MAG: nitrogenase component 1 [Eubacteriales bacterium]
MKDNMEEMEAKMDMMRKLSGMERCPLSSAAKAIASIEGAAMLIIGTEECTYYSKVGIIRRGGGDICFSVVMDKHDVTFGSADKVAAAIDELMEITTPKTLFLVTTCVPEIIGEDYQSIVQEAEEKYKLPIHLLTTNHYTGKDGEYGFELVEKAIGYALPRKKKRDGQGNSPMGKMGEMAHKFAGKGQGGRPEGGRPEGGRPRGDMSEEEMMAMMRDKMGGHMSDEEIREKLHSRMGGGGRR